MTNIHGSGMRTVHTDTHTHMHDFNNKAERQCSGVCVIRPFPGREKQYSNNANEQRSLITIPSAYDLPTYAHRGWL